MRNIAIIGGGASGYLAAITAARYGGEVTIYERCDRTLKKVLATGNGRCNMTNMCITKENYYSEDKDFVNSVIETFSLEDTLNFFHELGVVTKTEEDKVYPYSLQASAISDVLRLEAERLGVKTMCNFEVSSITKKGNGFLLCSYKGEEADADCVILATGGKASPDLGSNGSGYKLAERFGHKITPLYPSLVQIKTENTYTKSLQGLKVPARAMFYEEDEKKAEYQGEVLFADYGLSGPPIFNLSRLAATSKNGEIRLDIMPEFSEGQVFNMLFERTTPDKNLENFFTGMLPKKLGQVLLKSCGISPLSRMSDTLTKKEISALAKRIKGWSFLCHGTRSWNNAQVTAGGIRVLEVSKDTMESKLVRNLYFCGEILDVDGDCGGYNLQWAWSSGYLAGKNAARDQ